MTHYEILKVACDAPQEVIRAAYRALAQNNHPDLSQSPDVEQIMKMINEAYTVLSDPIRRNKYDELLGADKVGVAIDAAVANYVRKSKKSNVGGRVVATARTPVFTSATPAGSASSQFDIKQKADASGFSPSWALMGSVAILLLGLGWFSLSDDRKVEVRGLFGMLSRPHAVVADRESLSLLEVICNHRNITGHKCESVIDYPIQQMNGQACDLTLTDQKIEGNFLRGQSSQILAGYLSSCEPHAANFGGSVLFEKVNGSIVFKGYKPGNVFSGCASIPGDNGRDRLFCSAGGMGQGYLETGIFEVLLKRAKGGAVDISTVKLISAVDSVGALGANLINCRKGPQIFSVGSPKAGKSIGTIIFEAEYADDAVIRKTCAPNAVPPKELVDGAARAKLGEAFIGKGDIKKGYFALNIATRHVQKFNP